MIEALSKRVRVLPTDTLLGAVVFVVANRYTSDEDALSGPGHRTHNSPFDRSARHRRSGSFRRSGKRQRGAGASPRITPRSGIGESKASAAAEFGDDEGSPVENSPEARPKVREMSVCHGGGGGGGVQNGMSN